MIKRFAIILPVLLLLSLVAPFVVLAQEFHENENIVLSQDEAIDQDYFAAGDTVTLSGTVNGDAYLAGGTIFVDGTINGDLLVAGGTVSIRGTVTEDVRAAGGTVTISGDIGGNITVGAGTTLITDSAAVDGSLVAGTGTLEIFAPLGRGATIGAGQATIGSEINGNIVAGIGQMTLTNDATINGDLTYYSEQGTNLTRSDSASVSGTVTHNVPVRHEAVTKEEAAGALTGVGFFFKLLSLLSSLLLGLILIHVFPGFTKRTTDHIGNEFLKSSLIGFLTFLLTPILIIVLFITLIGIPFAIILIPLLIALTFFAKVFAMFFIGQRVMSFLNQKVSSGWTLFIGVVVYGFLTAIPFFGWIVSILALFSGTGALFIEKKHLYKSMRSKKLL